MRILICFFPKRRLKRFDIVKPIAILSASNKLNSNKTNYDECPTTDDLKLRKQIVLIVVRVNKKLSIVNKRHVSFSNMSR